jgi:hypothetical protein
MVTQQAQTGFMPAPKPRFLRGCIQRTPIFNVSAGIFQCAHFLTNLTVGFRAKKPNQRL